MDLEKFTQKSLEALENAKRLAQENGNQELRQEHLLAALTADGLIPELTEKCGAASLGKLAGDAVAALPKVGGSSSGVYMSPELDAEIRAELSRGASYAAARQRAAERLAGRPLAVLERPNDILAIEYIKAMRAIGSAMEPFAVPRSGAHDAADAEYPSASVLRAALRSGGHDSARLR